MLEVDTGKLLAAVGEHVPLNPASNAKLYTAAAALATLRGEHRYETTLTGRLDGDAVSGPLAIRGFGDPSLTTSDLWDMVQELKGFGVKRIEGDVVVDQRFYDDQTTPAAFEQQPNEWAGFRAPVSAVALDENCVTMTVRPTSPGNAARVEFDPPGFIDSDGSIKTAEGGGADTVELTLAGNGSRMTAHVSGSVAGDSRVVRFTRRAEDPRLLAGYALKALLEKADVKVSGDVKLGNARGHTLAKHLSAPLSQLLYALGKQSDNFYAEMIFRTLGGEARGRPRRAPTRARSSRASSVASARPTPASSSRTARASSTPTASRRGPPWSCCAGRTAIRRCSPSTCRSSSVGGVDGTLHKRFHQELTRRRVRAKTGTLDDVDLAFGLRPARRRTQPDRLLDPLQPRRRQAGRRPPRRRQAGRAGDAVLATPLTDRSALQRPDDSRVGRVRGREAALTLREGDVIGRARGEPGERRVDNAAGLGRIRSSCRRRCCRWS